MDPPGSSSSAEGAQVPTELELVRVDVGQPVEVHIKAPARLYAGSDVLRASGRTDLALLQALVSVSWIVSGESKEDVSTKPTVQPEPQSRFIWIFMNQHENVSDTPGG